MDQYCYLNRCRQFRPSLHRLVVFQPRMKLCYELAELASGRLQSQFKQLLKCQYLCKKLGAIKILYKVFILYDMNVKLLLYDNYY